MPFFSVIIPTFNRSAILPRAVKSIMNQSFLDWELIIVDDGSQDNTKEIAQVFLNDSRVKYILQENQGVCAARNLGSEKANGEYITFLDSDDYVNEKWLMDFYTEILKSNPDVVRCKAIVNMITETDSNVLLAGNFTLKKELFLKIGKYDTNLKFGENTELKWRLEKENAKFSNISDFNFFYDNDLSNNSDKKKENQIEFTYYILKKHQDLFLKNKRWTQLVYQISGVNCIKLGRIKEGKTLIWKGYFSNPKHIKSLIRAIRYSITKP